MYLPHSVMKVVKGIYSIYNSFLRVRRSFRGKLKWQGSMVCFPKTLSIQPLKVNGTTRSPILL